MSSTIKMAHFNNEQQSLMAEAQQHNNFNPVNNQSDDDNDNDREEHNNNNNNHNHSHNINLNNNNNNNNGKSNSIKRYDPPLLEIAIADNADYNNNNNNNNNNGNANGNSNNTNGTKKNKSNMSSPASSLSSNHQHPDAKQHDPDHAEEEDNADKPMPSVPPTLHDYKGGYKAHIARRVYHVITCTLVPWLFFWYFHRLCDSINIHVSKGLSFIILVQIIVEAIRIRFGIIIFGQREYERNQVCAQAWGLISMCVVLMLAYPRAFSIDPVFTDTPSTDRKDSQTFACYAQLAMPIIWGLGFGDPLIGELKRFGVGLKARSAIAIAVLMFVYLMTFLWCGTPFWLMFILPPIAVAAEYPKLSYIDDNAMMLLVPLLFSLLLEPWFTQKCDQIFY